MRISLVLITGGSMMTVLNNRQLNNRGASVIELLIIMAIIAVLLSGSIIAFSILDTSNIKQASRTTKSYIEKTRSSTMSVVADEWSFTLTREGVDYKAIVNKTYKNDEGASVTDKVEEKLLGTRIAAALVSGASETAINENDVLKITFEPASGSVKKVTLNGTEYNPAENMISIKFTSGNGVNYVKLYFVSGKVEIE